MYCLKLLLFLPLLIHSKIQNPSSFDINLEFNFDLGSILNQLKSSTPEYIKDIQKNMSEFLKKTDKEKDKYLEILSIKVQETYSHIKKGMKKGSENAQNEIIKLIEQITETANTLSIKVCNVVKSEYKQCFNNKKRIFNNLIQIVEDNFGKCSVIVNEIYNLSENMEFNLKYFLFLAISLTENPDIIKKGTSQIIYDIINCIQEKFPNLWPSINATITKAADSLNIKQDIINLLAKSILNFVTLIKYKESYGFIEKAENLTGFIKDETAKKVYKIIFEILKKFNEFGTRSYKISANLNINVFINNDNSTLIKTIDNIEKGIKIKLHLSYIFKNLKIHSVQAVIFESPLISFRAERKSKGGIANTFVGITLYDKEGNEIYIPNLKLDKIEILFKKKLFKAMKTCLYYNEEKNEMDNDGIDTKFVEFDGEEYIMCIPKHLSSFTIGSFGEEIMQQKIGSNNMFTYKNLKIGIFFLLLFGAFYIYHNYRRKRIEFDSQYYEYFI